MTITSVTTKKVAVAVLGLAMLSAVAFALPVKAAGLTESQIQSILSLLSSFGADQSVISNVNSSLRGQATTGGTTTAGSYTFSANLTVGSTGADVMALQKLLNSDSATQVAASGAGSPGNETSTFGPATKAAVIKFQTKNGISPASGYFGPLTRAKANSMGGATGGTTGGTTTTPAPATGTGLMVTSAVQPAASLAPDNATRIPFTKFMVTAGTDGAVVMNSVTIERTGLANNAAFSGVILVDEAGNQLGIEKTLNSNNQATVGEAVTIPAGQTRTFTVAANRADTNAYAGQVASFSVIAINTSATVTGSLPIVGASHTINESLSIGSVTVSRGALDPGSNQTKEVGTTNYTFSSAKVTAGSAEDIYFKSIRWNQTGSAGSGDLANVKTIVDGTEYPTTVSADGKYYSTIFSGDGLLVAKGASKDISVKGDIVGGSNRGVDFDIAKRTDMYMVGKTYGYGIKAPVGDDSSGTDDSAFHTTDDPWYDASEVTVSAGTIAVSSWTMVSSQNVAENLLNQPIGGFTIDVKGEPITVGTLKFGIGTTGTGQLDDVTNLTLVNENGAVVAGPKDGSSATAYELVSFSDSVTFPIGITRLTLKGKLGTDFATGDTISASTTASGWGSVTGQATGNTITPTPSSTVTSGATMTLKAGALTVSVSSVPIAQTVIAGSSQFHFASYIFDGTASGEDMRITTIPLYFSTDGTRTDLTNCKLYDGSTVLNSNNVKNPATTDTASSTSFTFDGTGLVVPKGTSKTINLKCDIKSGTTSSYWWGIDAGQNSNYTGVSGVTSGQTIAETFTDSSGQTMTASAGGTLSVVLDTASPGYALATAGSAGVELARLKFSALNEDVDLRQVALVLESVASNTPVDLVNREVKLYTDTGTLIGTAVFPTGDNATSSQISNFRVPRDGSKVIVVKGDIAGISVSGPLTASGDLLVVNYDTNNESGTDGTYGVGVSSGSNRVPTTGVVTSPSGVRIVKAYPTLERLSVPSLTLVAGENKLYRFKVTAVGGDVALAKFSFNVSSSTVAATTTSYAVYAYNDSGFSTADTTFSATGLVNANSYFNGLGETTGATAQVSNVEIYPNKSSATTTYIVPSGATRYFEFRATASNLRTTTGSESVTVKLLGDSAFPTGAATLMLVAGTSAGASGVDADTNDNFIWSPISTTTQNSINDLDFTNGYQVSGLPASGMTTQTFTQTI